MPAICAFNPGKAILQNSAVKIPVNNLLDIRAKKNILPAEAFFINLLEGFKMILHTLIVRRALGIALAAYGFRHR